MLCKGFALCAKLGKNQLCKALRKAKAANAALQAVAPVVIYWSRLTQK